MARYVITIRDRREGHAPTCYYLSKRGLRCYDARNIAVMHSLAEAQKDLAYFAPLMPTFSLTIEKLRPRLSLSKALLSAVPVEA